jgi:hypothetical protein
MLISLRILFPSFGYLVFFSHSLFHVVYFPTRFSKTLCSTIDCIFMYNSKVILLKILPIINGLSDHFCYNIPLLFAVCINTFSKLV